MSIDNIFDLVGKLEESGPESEGEIDLGGGRKAQYTSGFRINSIPQGVRSGRAGRSADQPADQVGRVIRRKSPKAAKPDVDLAVETREPKPDVMDEGDHILVVVEMPGVETQEIQFVQEEDKLNLNTTGNRRYQVSVSLPAAVDTERAEISTNNGVVSLRLPKR